MASLFPFSIPYSIPLIKRAFRVKRVEIRKPEQFQNVAFLIIPGGESTTMAKLAEYYNLLPALREFVKIGRPVWGTYAGLIILAISYRHSYFLKMANDIGEDSEEASSSLVPVEVNLSYNQQPRNDLPVFQ